MGAEFDEGFAIGINENQNHDHAAELLALRKAAKAADQARKPRGEPLEDTEDERRQVMAILERLAAAEKENEELRQRLLAAEEDARSLRDVAYIANGIVGAGLLDGRRVKDDLTAALAKTEQPGFLFEKAKPAVIESRRIVSEPGAAIEVTQYTLSPAARAALNLGDAKLPDCDDE